MAFDPQQIAHGKKLRKAVAAKTIGNDVGDDDIPEVCRDILFRRAMQQLAAIEIREEQSSAMVLDVVVETLRSEGIVVAGYLQRELLRQGDTTSDTVLEDIETGEQFVIMQALGSSATSCRLDTQALADIAGRALGRLEQPADILVLNRFGKAEAEGHGLRAVLETAIKQGIPVLTSVGASYLEDWRNYVGDLAVNLPPDVSQVLAWSRSIMKMAPH